MGELESAKVLAVDDDPAIRVMVKTILSRAGAQVCVAADGREAMHQFSAQRPDLVVLDIMMPHIDGWEVCRQMLTIRNTPIIFLTALQEEPDVLRGLNSGAVDYVTKPFSPKVFVARACAALRKAASPLVSETPDLYQDGYLAIDRESRRVWTKGEPVRLSAVEYRLLAFFLEHAGQILAHKQILKQVWGWEYQESVEYVHVYVSRLRHKIELDPRHPRYLLTERGLGYCFEAQTCSAGDLGGLPSEKTFRFCQGRI